jgi:hypothetical protein
MKRFLSVIQVITVLAGILISGRMVALFARPAFADASTLFKEATTEVGFPAELTGENARVFDFNDDDYPDVFFVDTSGAPHAFLNEKGAFRESPVTGLAPLPPRGTLKFFRGLYGDDRIGALMIDSGQRPFWGDLVKQNGRIDYYTVALEDGILKFTPLDSGHFPRIGGSITDVHAFDYNQDGKLDLIITSFYTLHSVHSPEEAEGLHLFKGTGDLGGKSFIDFTQREGLYTRRGMDISTRDAPVPAYHLCVCDIDGDGKLDILVPGYGRRWNKLYLTGAGPNGLGKFRDRAHELGYDGDPLGIHDPMGNGNSYTAACADADNDGKIDVFQGEITHQWAGASSDLSAILWNQFPESFLRVTELPRPLAFKNQGDQSSMWGDLDLDGLQDLVVADSGYPPETHMLIWHQKAPRQLEDWTHELDDPWVNPSGPVLFDFDLDGDLDLISASTPAKMPPGNKFYGRFYKNQYMETHSQESHHWMEVILRRHDSRVPLVPYGSKVKVYLPSGTTLLRELVDGYGGTSQGPETLHFGLGELPSDVSELPVSITWTNGDKQDVLLPIDQLSRVVK